MFCLIDGDILVYKAGCAVQTVIHQGFDDTGHLISESNYIKDVKACNKVKLIRQNIQSEPLKHALYLIKKQMARIIEATGATDYLVYLTHEDLTKNFRFKLDSNYKQNRKAPKPIHYDKIRQYLIKKYNTEIVEGIEADDALGIAQTALNKQGIKAVIASIDKDLLQIPGLHYNIDKDCWTEVSNPGKLWLEKTKSGKNQLKGYGELWFWAQMLLGDITDNIRGIKSYGDVKTFKTLTDRNTIPVKDTVYSIYKINNRLDDFETNRKLLWIKRDLNEQYKY